MSDHPNDPDGPSDPDVASFDYAGGRPEEPGATAGPGEADAGDAEPQEADRPDDEPRGMRRSDILIGVGVLAVLLIVGVVFSTVVGGDDDAGGGGAAVTSDATDDFNRPFNPTAVGVAATGDSWDAVSGTWGVDAAQLYVAVPAASNARNLVVLDMGSSDGQLSAVFARVRLGAGMVFWYESPDDFWVVLPATGFGTWIVQHLVDNEAVVNESLGLADSADGTSVSITLDGGSITGQVGEEEPVTIDVDDPGTSSLVGFTAEGFGSTDARWDDFYAVPAS